MNILSDSNPGFESGIGVGWTCVTGCSAETSGENLLWQTTSMEFDATAGAQIVSSAEVTLPGGLYGAACEGRFLLKGGAQNRSFHLSCSKAGADAKQSVQVYKSIPKLAETINEFSAYLSDGSGTAVVSRENVDWINGNCTNGSSGNYTCTLNSGVFAEIPNCVVVNAQGSPADASCSINATSTTSFNIGCRNQSNTTNADKDTLVFCQKSGSDYKTPIVQPIVSIKYGELVGVSTQPREYIQNFECKTTSSVGTALGDSVISTVGNMSSGNCRYVACQLWFWKVLF